MSFAPTDFCRPESGEELADLLERYDGGALILAGGTFVHGLDARGLLGDVKALIDIRGLGLDTVESGVDGLRIGATTTGAVLAHEPAVCTEPWLGSVADALAFVPTQIRNAATVGGAVATACALFDLPVALIALDGSVAAQGSGGTRVLELQDFFAGMFQNTLAHGEFVSEVRLPQPPPRTASAFGKLETNANDLAIVNAAVRITLDDAGSCTDARVVIGGGVGAIPVRAASAEQVLAGATPDETTLRRAADAAAAEIDPQSDHRASGAYRSKVAGVLVRRALERALARLA